MLELPEAQVLERQINDTISGKRIIKVDAACSPHKFAFYFGDPHDYHNLLVGEAIGKANLKYKKEHSLRVRDHMLILGRDLHLDANQMFLAEVIGLLHDVGRFEQYVKYHTFKDCQSEDHAKLGLSVLAQEQIFTGRVSEMEKEIFESGGLVNLYKKDSAVGFG